MRGDPFHRKHGQQTRSTSPCLTDGRRRDRKGSEKEVSRARGLVLDQEVCPSPSVWVVTGLALGHMRCVGHGAVGYACMCGHLPSCPWYPLKRASPDKATGRRNTKDPPWPARPPQSEVDSPAGPSLGEPALPHLQSVSQHREAGGALLATCKFTRRKGCAEPLEAGVSWSRSTGVAAAD
ncbi:hypothetical protein HJG60_011682 [Phyllostomus discolor]|uniref:Uncharacterized protein n=1 Tax=Phyllostomus discolor TaxID=89673 RepID=A0A834E1D2_9CHIR|nr:hypothetical protein HJG60_011682 [Phyllostomus discolor]